MLRGLGTAFAGLVLCGSASANAIVNLSGTFPGDDTILQFQYHVQNAATVDIFTTSYATGGFSPVLTLFDSTGAFLFDSRGYPTNSDASLSWFSNAGEDYAIVLTEWDNLSPGPGYFLSDGFSEQGQGNFTAQPPFNPPLPGAFYLPGPIQLTGAWAITFSSTENSLTVTPEPGSALTLLGGLALLLGWKKVRVGK